MLAEMFALRAVPPSATPSDARSQPHMVPLRRRNWRIASAISLSLMPIALLPLAATAVASGTPLAQSVAVALYLGAAAVAASLLSGDAGRFNLGTNPWHRAGAGLLLGVAGLCWSLFAAGLGGRVVPGQVAPTLLLLIGTVAVAAQVAGEEVFFRGWLQPALARLLPVSAAILLTSLSFAAVHLFGGVRSPVSLLNIALAGGWFGLLAWRGGGLAAPVAAHGGWNAGEALLTGVDQPGLGPWGAVVDLELSGPAIWGGGPEGLNASIIVTLVLCGLILLVLAPHRGQG